MNRQTQRHVNRMNNLVRSIEEAPVPSLFNMSTYGYFTKDECGSPSCALGHYAFRRDLQKTFLLNKDGDITLRDGSDAGLWEQNIAPHFGITSNEAEELFEISGCDYAAGNRTAAIDYIKKFINRKWGVLA